MGVAYFAAGFITVAGAVVYTYVFGPIAYPSVACPDWVIYSGGHC